MRLAAIAAGLFALLPLSRLGAQSSRSLTDSENGILLAQGVAVTVPRADEDLDNPEELQEKILLLRSTVKSLTESLAIANSEAEVFKRQAADLALKLEALGIAGVEKDQGKLEQRLLAAVRDLRLAKDQHKDAVNQLLRLTEAIQVLMQATDTIDPQIRLTVETELRKTSEVLGSPRAARAEPVEASLSEGMVVDVKEELSLVVANIGAKQGVQIGMPFQVWRDEKHIGDVRVVDVRDRISGAIIQNLESEKMPIKTGDRLRVDARK